MRGGIISSFSVAITAIALLGQPCYGGDRKSDVSVNRESRFAPVADHAVSTPAMPVRGDTGARMNRADDPLSFVLLNSIATKPARAAAHDADAKEDQPTPPRLRKSLTFFRFQSKAGEVSVQPLVGGLKGAQFSLGF
jgi:hypothetical protein